MSAELGTDCHVGRANALSLLAMTGSACRRRVLTAELTSSQRLRMIAVR